MQRYYAGIWQYLKANRWWCLASFLLLAELLLYACLNSQSSAAYQSYVEETQPAYSGLFSFIFIENAKASLVCIFSGFILFGIGTVLNVYLTVDSLVSTAKNLMLTITGRDLFLCILPHGLIEGTALIFAVTLSVLLSKAITSALIRAVRQQPVLSELKTDLHHIFGAYFLLILPFLFLSAVIETFFSPYIVQYLL